jgi:dTMP kinase
MQEGRLITLEGIDGAGKTTLSAALRDALGARGIEVRVFREPGGVDAAERIRDLVKDPELHVTARAEALLYAAARAQLVEEALEPLRQGGTWVLLDRFVDSSLAYQGGGRKLGIEAVRRINEFATGGLCPDRTLLLLVDPRVGRARSRARGGRADRLEREEEEFFARTSAAYAELAAANPRRFRTLDATLAPDRLLDAALEALADLL